jgi:hypothetical protein
MKKALVLATLLLIMVPCLAFALQANAQAVNFGLNAANNIGLPNTAQDPKQAAASIVRYLIGFLGIIAVVVILWGGFQWLTAGGNEDKVGSAKKTIISGLIGLVIIIAAYAIVTIVVGFANNVIGGTA